MGKAISDKLAELATTGRLRLLDRLRAEIPASLVELLQIPGLGPKTVRQLHQELGIESLDGLREAAESGRLRTVRGMSERTEAQVLEGLDRLAERPPARMLLDQAEELLTAVMDALARVPGVRSIEPAGSFRRRRESIGDLDLLAETAEPEALMAAFTSLGMVDRVVNRGTQKSAVGLIRGPQVDLMAMTARRRGHLSHPLHGVEGAQRATAGDGARSRLEPVGEGLPASRRGRRAAHRRRRRAAHVRDRGRRVRLPRAAVHRAGAARGRRRDRGRARRHGCRG